MDREEEVLGLVGALGTCLLDADGRVLGVDEEFGRLLGTTPALDQPLREYVPELPLRLPPSLTLRRREGPVVFELRCNAAAQRCRPVAYVATLRAIADTPDIAASLARELRVARHTMQSLLDACPIAILIMDLDKRITVWNRAGEQIFGWSEDELLGKRYPLVSAADFPAFERLFRRVIGGEGFTGVEATRLRRDGEQIPVRMHTAPMRDPEERVTGAMALLEDLRETRKLEEQVRHSQKMEAVGRLAGGVAHDFNNLLAVMFGMTELLAMDPQLGGEAREQVEEIRRCAESARQITAQLLAFGRREVVQARVLDLHQVLRRELPLLRRLIGDSIELELELCEGDVGIRIDPSQLDQILLNLAVNARDAMPSGGRLRVATRVFVADRSVDPDEPDTIELEISDTGTGIPPEVLPHVFEPFFTTKPIGQGTGLGLATVYAILRTAGGSIEVDSVVGQGACFRISLPRVELDAPLVATPKQARTSLPRGHERILLVDDEPGVRRSTAKLLASLGYVVVMAESGMEALERFEHERFDIVLTDLAMPQMSGVELAARIRERRPAQPVLFLSGNLDSEQLRCEIAEGQAVFLQKPVTLAALAGQVRELLDQAGMRGVERHASQQQ